MKARIEITRIFVNFTHIGRKIPSHNLLGIHRPRNMINGLTPVSDLKINRF